MSNENTINTAATDNQHDDNQDVNQEHVELSEQGELDTQIQTALEEANAKAEENWGLYLSAKAESVNIQKRADRDVANAHKYALDKFIPDLLAVKDALELGTKAAKENAEADNQQLEKFIEGSDMATTMFGDVLAKHGVTMIDPQNEPFNPEHHQAMTMIPNPDFAPNTVIEVVQKGYLLNERLIRPAMVIVSKAD